MISSYAIAARLACHLDQVADQTAGYLLPAEGTSIQRRMGAPLFACDGVGISVTSISPGPAQPNCAPEPRYVVTATIARPCAVEFNTNGQTLVPAADMLAQTMSLDAGVLWAAYGQYGPLIGFEITGGLGLTSASFTVSEFTAPICSYPVTPAVDLGL